MEGWRVGEERRKKHVHSHKSNEDNNLFLGGTRSYELLKIRAPFFLQLQDFRTQKGNLEVTYLPSMAQVKQCVRDGGT